MSIKIEINSKPVLDQLKELGMDRQGPFILSKALNQLAKQVQKDIRQNLLDTLNIRRARWITNQVAIQPGTWSTKTRLIVRIEATEAARFFTNLESGADKVPIQGHRFFAVPASKTFGRRILGPDDPLRVKNLNLKETPFGLQGLERTFTIKSKSSGTPLIMQRVAKDATGKNKRGRNRKTGLRLLYTLLHDAKIPKKIQWYSTANKSVVNNQVGIFADVMKAAIASAKK